MQFDESEGWYEVSATTLGPQTTLIAMGRPDDGKLELRFFVKWDGDETPHQVTQEQANTLLRMRDR